MERFRAGRGFELLEVPRVDWARLDSIAPIYVEVTDTGTAAAVLSIRHGLGRLPRGMKIVNQEVASGLGAHVDWFRETGDADWDATFLTARFTQNNAHVLLEVF